MAKSKNNEEGIPEPQPSKPHPLKAGTYTEVRTFEEDGDEKYLKTLARALPATAARFLSIPAHEHQLKREVFLQVSAFQAEDSRIPVLCQETHSCALASTARIAFTMESPMICSTRSAVNLHLARKAL